MNASKSMSNTSRLGGPAYESES
jgi:hypothetical protein